MKRFALISVTDKSGIAELATALVERGFSILASSGTASVLREADLEVAEVGDYTGVGELLGGRVKTLSPKIFAGILSRSGNEDDSRSLAAAGLDGASIEVLVCNLYDFPGGGDPSDAIDIGGHALLRAAVKSREKVAVAVSPSDYDSLLQSLDATAEDALEIRSELAGRAWAYLSEYDSRISEHFDWKRRTDLCTAELPSEWSLPLIDHSDLRYGENPHQKAKWYRSAEDGFHCAEVIQGKQLSYNNILDATAAWALVSDLGTASAAVIKHQTPCGAAKHDSEIESITSALNCDRKSAFGGIVAVNGVLNAEAAEVLSEMFLEVVIARNIDEDARRRFSSKKNLRLVEWTGEASDRWEARTIPGGMLVQERDLRSDDGSWKVVTREEPTSDQWDDMRVAEVIAKHARSNAIVLVKGRVLAGVGAGQVSRVDAVRIAVDKAGENRAGASLASDAFFPFPDGLEEATGVKAVIQPGGSVRDDEVIEAADRLGMTMVFTGCRHFRH